MKRKLKEEVTFHQHKNSEELLTDDANKDPALPEALFTLEIGDEIEVFNTIPDSSFVSGEKCQFERNGQTFYIDSGLLQ